MYSMTMTNVLPNGIKSGRNSKEALMKRLKLCTHRSFFECSCLNIQTLHQITTIHSVLKMWYMTITIGIALHAKSTNVGITGIVDNATNVILLYNNSFPFNLSDHKMQNLQSARFVISHISRFVGCAFHFC